MSDIKIKFCGGAGKVTGANFLLESDNTKVLVDCGLIQGSEEESKLNTKDFPFDPAEIDFLFVTHAHIDHIGRIGKLVKDGFNGVIYSIDATKDLAVYMFEDALKLMRREYGNDPLYGSQDIDKALSIWKTFTYNENVDAGDFSVNAKDAGHILGSATYKFIEKVSGKSCAFTGDLGNSPSSILRDTEYLDDVDYLVMESVYGDRNHNGAEQRLDNLSSHLKKVIDRGGVSIIPVFSLEKTQVLLHELDNLIEDNKIPSVPVFLDSPLGIKLTSVYKNYSKYFKDEVQEEIEQGDDIFDFPRLSMTFDMESSQKIRNTKPPMIIISSSGMSEGGRITGHEKQYLSDPKNAIFFIGYQVSGSLGRVIREGAKRIKIEGKYIDVKADIISIGGYSSHKDSDGLFDFVEKSAGKLKKVFVTMGEEKSSFFLAQKIRDNLDIPAVVPELGSEYTL